MGDFPESEKMEEKVSDVMTRGMDSGSVCQQKLSD